MMDFRDALLVGDSAALSANLAIAPRCARA